MKGRIILIDMPKDRASQAALLVDGRLEDLLLDPPKGDTSPAPGKIYWAKVDRLVPKIGSAFVKLTPEYQGFLREAKGLKEGAAVLVQVTSHPEPGKAIPVATRLLFKGRLIIHTPGAPGINVSRQITDRAERARLEALVADIVSGELAALEAEERRFRQAYENGGFILRSAAVGASPEALRTDLQAVVASAVLTDAATEIAAPRSAGNESWALKHALVEWATPTTDAVHATARAHSHLMQRYPEFPDWLPSGFPSDLLARLQRNEADLFDHYGVWDEIEKLKSPRVDLPSGAWMAVETTRAMVTVDVNTAGEFGGGAALTANLEAARELPRQLRLRGLGGQIAIDFAPLPKKDRKRIEDALRTSFRRDAIETTLAGWTPLGHFELQRKRERRPLSELLG